jgi:hypothetical protein
MSRTPPRAALCRLRGQSSVADAAAIGIMLD